MVSIGSLVSAAVLAILVPWASASTFLQAHAPHTEKWVSRDAVQEAFRSALFMDVESLRKSEDELRPMYSALPKKSDGTLEPAVVRYALHRYFVFKHGWYMKGLEPTSSEANSSSPAGILKDRVPEVVQGLLEEHMDNHGWHLHELAICSAALSELIQREVIADLVFVYSVLDLPTATSLSTDQLGMVLDTYLAQYLLDESWSDWRQSRMFEEMWDTYDGWNDLRLWAQDVRHSLESAGSAVRNPFVKNEVSFARAGEAVQEMMHRYTSVQNLECSSLTQALLDIEYRGSGRVLLTDFYRVGLADGKIKRVHKFFETKEYLRHVGALDESDSKRPAIIIPNYVYGMNNCLASSSFFSVCCTNKCEYLMGHLELAFAAPSATPQRVVEVVSTLSSDTVDAPRNLSAPLLARLGEIAEHHEGQVPLHGRLFAQWMHHAYPRECPFPQAERAQNQLTPEAWSAETGVDWDLPDHEMRHLAYSSDKQLPHDAKEHDELPWSSKEELVGRDHDARRTQLAWGFGGVWRKGMAVMAVASIAAPVLRAWSVALPLGTAENSKFEKHLV